MQDHGQAYTCARVAMGPVKVVISCLFCQERVRILKLV